jgi:hypothetical protein
MIYKRNLAPVPPILGRYYNINIFLDIRFFKRPMRCKVSSFPGFGILLTGTWWDFLGTGLARHSVSAYIEDKRRRNADIQPSHERDSKSELQLSS